MFERPRGTRDFLPEDNRRRRHLEEIFREVSGRFGYGEVSTPTFEHAELFIAKSGPGVLDEMYAFKDKAGRELALRPELTAPVIRLYLNTMTKRPKPVKLYYIGNCFRYDEPQKGRYREFWQYGVEILGANPLEADAEVIATAMAALRLAGVQDKLELRIGHIGILRGLIDAEPGVKARILGRLDKRDTEGLRRELRDARLSDLEGPLVAVADLRGGADALDRAAEVLGEGKGGEALRHLRDLEAALGEHGVGGIRYDLGVVRGLDYYTGMVFEVHYLPLGAASQLCGGGAYSLAEVLGGEAIPTTGFGMGVDRVQLAMEEAGARFPTPHLQAFLVPIGASMRGPARRVLRSLRDQGITADMDLVGRGPSKNLDYANGRGARYALLLGEEEWRRGAVALREMATGTQREVKVEDLPRLLKD